MQFCLCSKNYNLKIPKHSVEIWSHPNLPVWIVPNLRRVMVASVACHARWGAWGQPEAPHLGLAHAAELAALSCRAWWRPLRGPSSRHSSFLLLVTHGTGACSSGPFSVTDTGDRAQSCGGRHPGGSLITSSSCIPGLQLLVPCCVVSLPHSQVTYAPSTCRWGGTCMML